jgi:hypothetical protein
MSKSKGKEVVVEEDSQEEEEQEEQQEEEEESQEEEGPTSSEDGEEGEDPGSGNPDPEEEEPEPETKPKKQVGFKRRSEEEGITLAKLLEKVKKLTVKKEEAEEEEDDEDFDEAQDSSEEEDEDVLEKADRFKQRNIAALSIAYRTFLRALKTERFKGDDNRTIKLPTIAQMRADEGSFRDFCDVVCDIALAPREIEFNK